MASNVNADKGNQFQWSKPSQWQNWQRWNQWNQWNQWNAWQKRNHKSSWSKQNGARDQKVEQSRKTNSVKSSNK